MVSGTPDCRSIAWSRVVSVMLPCRAMMKPPAMAALAVAIPWLSCAVVEAVNVVVMDTNLWKALRSGEATYHAQVFSC